MPPAKSGQSDSRLRIKTDHGGLKPSSRALPKGVVETLSKGPINQPIWRVEQDYGLLIVDIDRPGISRDQSEKIYS
jgi:hypothetical protein